MEKITVLHVGIDSHLGGIETFLLSLAQNLDLDRFRFVFLGYDKIAPCFHDELEALGCEFRYVRGRRTSWLGNIADLKRLFETEHFDIVHCHQNSLSYVTPALIARRLEIPVIIHSHNGGSVSGLTSILSSINRRRMDFGGVTKIAVSDVAGKWMFGENQDFHILNNGIDTGLFEFSDSDRADKRKELGLKTNDEVFINVGAFRPQKNHSFLIDVFKAYLAEEKDAKLLLVGTGDLLEEMRDKVEQLGISDSVLFLGSRRDVPQLLSASDKLLFPSLYEGFPISLIEAEANGLMCIASSAITGQACLENCVQVNLDDPIDVWVSAMGMEAEKDRRLYAESVRKAGFGIDTEVLFLENLYEKLVE